METLENVSKTRIVIEADAAIRSIGQIQKALQTVAEMKFGNIQSMSNEIKTMFNQINDGAKKANREISTLGVKGQLSDGLYKSIKQMLALKEATRKAELAQRKLNAARVQSAVNGLTQTGTSNRKSTQTTQTEQKQDGYTSIAGRIRDAKTEAAQMYEYMQKNNTAASQLNFQRAVQQYHNLVALEKDFHRSLSGTNTLYGQVKKTLADIASIRIKWEMAGQLLAMVQSIPNVFVETYGRIEAGVAGLEQVMKRPSDLLKQVQEETKGLVNLNVFDEENFKKGLQEATLDKMKQDVFEIASEFGEATDNVIESAKLWGRAYKDAEVVKTMTHASATLAVADSFSMIEANKALESSVMQWGMEVKNVSDAIAVSNRIIDSWTNLAHNYTVSAQTLATANERCASTAKLVGVSFDSTQALIASLARSTQAEGAEIGNALKSIFASIHSDKAIRALEQFGVAVYKDGKTSQDAVKEFRNVEAVLVDLMLKSQDTTQNMEKLYQAISGGKWQWNKAGAMMNYNEYITALNLSLNSSGIAAEQVQMQVDTLFRKIESLKVEGEKLLANNDSLGGAAKTLITELTTMLKALNHIPSGVFTVAAAIVTAGGAFRMFSGILKTCKTTFDTVKTSSTTAAAALNLLGAAIPIGRVMSLTKALAALAVSVGVLEGVREAFFSVDAAIEELEETTLTYQKAASKTDELERNIHYVETYCNSLKELSRQQEETQKAKEEYDRILRESNGLNEEAKQKLEELGKKEQQIDSAIMETKAGLSQIIKEEGVTRLETADFTEDAVAREIGAAQEQVEAERKANEKIREVNAIRKQETIDNVNQIIMALNKEGASWWDLATNVTNALGIIDGAFAAYHSYMAEQKRELANEFEWLGNKMTGLPSGTQLDELTDEQRQQLLGENQSGFSLLSESGEGLLSLAEILKESADENTKSLDELRAKAMEKVLSDKRKLIQSDLVSDAAGDSYSSAGTGYVYNNNDDGDGGSGSRGSDSGSKQPQVKDWTRDKNAVAYKQMLNDLEEAQKKYELTLEGINGQEALFGETIDTKIERLAAMRQRVDELTDSQKRLEEERERYLSIADEMAQNSAEVMEALERESVSWNELTKEEQEALISKTSLSEEYQKQWKQAITFADELRVKIADIKNQVKSLNNEAKKTQFGDSLMQEKQWERAESNANIKKQSKLLDLDKASPLWENTESKINIENALKRLSITREKIEAAKAELVKATENSAYDNIETYTDKLNQLKLQEKEILKEITDEEKKEVKEMHAALADVLDDLIVQGESLKDIWSNIWQSIASDAIKALLGVENSTNVWARGLGRLFGDSNNQVGSSSLNSITGYASRYLASGSVGGAGQNYSFAGFENLIPALDSNTASQQDLFGINTAMRLVNQTGSTMLNTSMSMLSTNMMMLSNAIMSNTMALETASATGGASAGGFSLLGSLFGGNAQGGTIQDGGLMRGAGTGTSDSILTYFENKGMYRRLSDGEYVIKEKAVKSLGIPILDYINEHGDIYGAIERFANGGIISDGVDTSPSPNIMKSYRQIQQSNAERNSSSGTLKEISGKLDNVGQTVENNDYIQITAVDSRSFVQLLNQHSGVIVNMMRKEKSRGNRV